MTEAPQPLSARIKAARLLAGLSQAELGRRIGADRLTVLRWERGKNRPGPQHRRRLQAEFPELPADYFSDGLTGDELELFVRAREHFEAAAEALRELERRLAH